MTASERSDRRTSAASNRCIATATMLAALLAACSSAPPAPDWQADAKGSLDRATAAYLEGDERVATHEFGRARAELARTADPALVARAVLTRCAAEVASLVFAGCPAFDSLAPDVDAGLRAYARYIAGEPLGADAAALLPARHRAAAAAPVDAATLAAIDDPLARLVAAGVTMRRGEAGPAVAALAVDTASQQGWRRPLLAWLTVQKRAAEAAGSADLAARLGRRIDLLFEPPKGGPAPR